MKYKEEKEKKKIREEIIMSLPAFVNKLLLMIDSGLTLQDAFKRIADSYRKIESGNRNSFMNKIISLQDKSDKTGENPIIAFNMYGKISGVKELARVSNFLLDNQERGIDMWFKLEELSQGLWEERKRVVLEKIKLADTKMAFPLGIMLMSMILLMTAPALLQI